MEESVFFVFFCFVDPSFGVVEIWIRVIIAEIRISVFI